MLLKHVYLYLNLDEYPAELATPFGFRTRYLCNFLERWLRPLKFNAHGFSKICVQGRHQPLESCPIVSDSAALPTVCFDQVRYESLGREEHHEFFMEMLIAGLRKCAHDHAIPLGDLMAAIDEFRRGGYRNEWTYQKKLLRSVGLHACLLCRMDSERFVLTLKVERKGTTVFEQPVLETKPDELIFAHRFKEVVVEGNMIVVKNKFGKPTFSLDVAALA